MHPRVDQVFVFLAAATRTGPLSGTNRFTAMSPARCRMV
jgi:hypothetical protein